MRWMILFCLMFSFAVKADDVLFYQPLNVDARVVDEEWQSALDDARTAGVGTLIVQWTRHGSSDFGGKDGWLLERLRKAERQGFRLVVGLAYDPAYYERMADAQAVGMAWYQWLAANLAQQRWLVEHGGLQPAGWYLPLELDDRIFSQPALREMLALQLKVFRERIGAPVHLSAFSAGVLTPELYAEWLDGLPVDRVWWQDGLGTGALAPEVLQAYREALPCSIGIVAEAFRQTSTGAQAFIAEPAEPQLDTGCHPRAVFSLRYRPWGEALLRNQRAADR